MMTEPPTIGTAHHAACTCIECEAKRHRDHEQISLDAQIKCVRRELAMRKNVYPKWVTNGRMKQAAADHEIAALQAVHDTLTATGWCPIESAPKDGTSIIVTNGTAVGEAHWCDPDGWFWANCYPTDATDGAVWNATKWLPLPVAG